MKKLGLFLAVLLACVTLGSGVAYAQYNSEVILDWHANSEADLAGYKIYYSGESGPPYSGTGAVEGASPITVTLDDLEDRSNPYFSLTGFPEGTYWFVLTAFDTQGLESDFSDKASATIDMSAPEAPSDVTTRVVISVDVTVNLQE